MLKFSVVLRCVTEKLRFHWDESWYEPLVIWIVCFCSSDQRSIPNDSLNPKTVPNILPDATSSLNEILTLSGNYWYHLRRTSNSSILLELPQRTWNRDKSRNRERDGQLEAKAQTDCAVICHSKNWENWVGISYYPADACFLSQSLNSLVFFHPPVGNSFTHNDQISDVSFRERAGKIQFCAPDYLHKFVDVTMAYAFSYISIGAESFMLREWLNGTSEETQKHIFLRGTRFLHALFKMEARTTISSTQNVSFVETRLPENFTFNSSLWFASRCAEMVRQHHYTVKLTRTKLPAKCS